MAEFHVPAEAQADAAMGDGASHAPAGTAPTPSRGGRPNGRGYNGGWNAQSDKLLQSAVLAARLGGGGEVKVKHSGGEVEVTISVKHRADSEPELVAQTRQLRLQGVAAQQQRFEEAQAAAAAARAARTAKNRRDKERKKEKARLRREQQSEPTPMADEDEISDEQQLSMAAATVVANVNKEVAAARQRGGAPEAPPEAEEVQIAGSMLVVSALAGTDGASWSRDTLTERVLYVARAGLASREQGEAAYRTMMSEYLLAPSLARPLKYRVVRRPHAGDGG